MTVRVVETPKYQVTIQNNGKSVSVDSGKKVTVNLSGITATAAIADEPFVVTTASADLFGERVLTGTSDQVNITDNGAGSTVVLSIADDVTLPGTGAATMPDGTTGERPGTPANGMLRYNTTEGEFEGYASGSWGSLGGVSIGDAIGSGTAGSVLFVDASGNLAQDNANLFWDDSNDRLGIGTDSPAARLEVNSATATTPGLIVQTTDDDPTQLLVDCQSSAGATLLGLTADGDFAVGAADNTAPLFFDEGLGYLRVGGTGAPVTYFQIIGTHVSGQGLFNLTGTTHALAYYSAEPGYLAGFFLQESSVNQWGIFYDTTANQLQFVETGIATWMVIDDSTGYVGLGTTTPGGPLSIKYNTAYMIQLDRTANALIDNVFSVGVSSAGSTATDYMFLGTTLMPILRVTAAGLVGINCDAPAAKLEINTTTASVAGLIVQTTDDDGDVSYPLLVCQTSGEAAIGIEVLGDGKMGFFGATPVAQQTEITDELTTISHTAPGTPDYALQDLVDSGSGSAFGFATKDEGNTLLSVVANLQARVNELETALVTLGLLADAD